MRGSKRDPESTQDRDLGKESPMLGDQLGRKDGPRVALVVLLDVGAHV